MISGGLTRRYVQPLFEVALEKGVVEQVGEELKQLDQVLNENPELRICFNNPSIERQEKKAVAEKVFSDFNRYTINFLKVALDKNRPEVFGDALRVYTDLLNTHRGVTPGVIETAIPIDEHDVKIIEASLAKRFGGTLELESRVNPDLIGGIRVRVGNTVMDGSVRGRLAALKQTISTQ